MQHITKSLLFFFQDEVDSPFNFRRKLGNKLLKRDKHKKQEPQRQEPQIPNNEETPEIIKPNDAREEAQLFESGSNESLNQEPLEVTPGNDPLSQLASENPTKSAVISLLDPVEGSVERQKGGRSSALVGLCLSLEDHHQLKAFVQEFVGQRLLPHLEAVLKNLNEWVRKRREGGAGWRRRQRREGRRRQREGEERGRKGIEGEEKGGMKGRRRERREEREEEAEEEGGGGEGERKEGRGGVGRREEKVE